MNYHHLSLADRHYIEIEVKKGISQLAIAESLKRSQSTLSREIKRNKGLRGYRYKQANPFAQVRHNSKPKAIKLTTALKQQIIGYLEQDWSPEQIAGRLKVTGNRHLHHETIYPFILADKQAGGPLYLHLRHQGKKYRKRYGNANTRTGIPNRWILTSAQKWLINVLVLAIGRPIPLWVKLIKVRS